MAQLGSTIINGDLRANGTISTPSLTVNSKTVESLAGNISDSTTSANLVSAAQVVDYITSNAGTLKPLSAIWNSTNHDYVVSGGVSTTGWVNLSTAQTALSITGSKIGSEYLTSKTIDPGTSIILSAGYYPSDRTITASIADVDTESIQASNLSFVISNSSLGSSAVAVGTKDSSNYYPIVASGLTVTGTVTAGTAGWFSSASLTDSTTNNNMTVGKMLAATGTITNGSGAPSATITSPAFSKAESNGDLVVTASSSATPSAAAITVSTTAGYTPVNSSYSTKSAQTGTTVSASKTYTISKATFTLTDSKATVNTAGYISASTVILDTGTASAPVLSLTDQAGTALSVGTLNATNHVYPFSASLAGNVNIATKGFISAGNKAVSDTSVVVGCVNEAIFTNVDSSSTAGIQTFPYGKEVNISAGYTPGGIIKSSIGDGSVSISISGQTISANCNTAGYLSTGVVATSTIAGGTYGNVFPDGISKTITPSLSSNTTSTVSGATNLKIALSTTVPTSGYFSQISSGSSSGVTLRTQAQVTKAGYLAVETKDTDSITVGLAASSTYYLPITAGVYSASISSGGTFTPTIAADGDNDNISIGTITSTKPTSGFYAAVKTPSQSSKTVTAGASVTTAGYVPTGNATSKTTTVGLAASSTYYLPITAGVYSASVSALSGSTSLSKSNATFSSTNNSGVSVTGSTSISGTATAAITTAGYIAAGNKTSTRTTSSSSTSYISEVNIASGCTFGVANAGTTNITNTGTTKITTNTGTVNLTNWIIAKDSSNNISFTYSA